MCFLHGAWKREPCAHRKKCFNARGGCAPRGGPHGFMHQKYFFVLLLKSCTSPYPVYPPV